MKKWIALLSAVLLTLSCAMAESSDTAHTEILSFDANPTTGYSWVGFVLGGEAVQLDSAEGTYIPDDQTGMLCGAGGQTQYVVTAVKPGRSIITFDYRRSWENTSLEQKVYLAVVDQALNLSLMDVTETSVLQGTVLSIDEAEHTALIAHDTIGEILARFTPEMSLPTVDEQIVIYTDGTMTLSLPAMMNMATQPLLIPRRDVFGVELPDYAMPGFCSGLKLYFGSIEDIASFRRALYSDDRSKPEDMEFISAKLYGAKYSSQAAGKCEHTNVWGFPYFAWWDKLESVHLWIRYKDRFLRCVRARMTNLRIDTNEDASGSYSPGEQLWGYPHILEYRQPYHFSRMYEVEKTYETEDSLLYDLAHYDGSIELTTWLDDLFGDG